MSARFSNRSWLLLVLVLMPSVAYAQGGRIQLDSLKGLAAKASETVDVTVDSTMLKKSAGFLAGKGGDTEKLQQIIEGITGIYVRSYKFETPNAYSLDDIESIRKQVAREGWSRIVGVKEKDELTEVYLWKEGGANGGLVVISAESDELTVVNIVGTVDLASLAALGPLVPKLRK
jgi:hypothetical protein